MTLVAIVAAFLFFVLRAKERERRLRGRDKGFRYYLLVAFLDFLRAFLLVMIFYHALLVFVYAGSDWVSTTRLVRLEESLARLESYGKVAKLSAPITLGLLLALYVFGLCRFVPELKAYKKLVKRLYLIVALLASFTLLGSHFGTPAATLSIEIKRSRDAYGVFREEIRTAVDEEIASRLLQRILNALPPAYRDTFGSLLSVDRGLQVLQDYERKIKESGGKAHEITVFLKQHPGGALPKSQKELSPTPTLLRASENDTEVGTPSSSYAEIEKARAKVAERRKTADRARTEGERALVAELIKVLRDPAKKEALDSLIKEFPILGPISDVFFTAFDKKVEDFVKDKLDRLSESAVQEPERIADLVSDTAVAASSRTDVKVDFRISEKATRTARDWKVETEKIEALKGRGALDLERTVRAASAPKPPPRRQRVSTASDDDARIESLQTGLRTGWVVTRNTGVDARKLFVHERSDGGMLRNLRYLIKESPDGGTWTIYTPRGGFGGTSYGRKIGEITKPFGVEIGECSCS